MKRLSGGDETRMLEVLRPKPLDLRTAVTAFVKAEMKRVPRRKKYLSDLCLLERLILNDTHSLAEGLMYHRLRERYPRAWAKVFGELEPSVYRRIIDEEKVSNAEYQVFMRRHGLR